MHGRACLARMNEPETPSVMTVLEWIMAGEVDRLIASIPCQMEVRQARALFEGGQLQVSRTHFNPHDPKWHSACIGPEELDLRHAEGFQEGFGGGYEAGLHDGRKETREAVLAILAGAGVSRPVAV